MRASKDLNTRGVVYDLQLQVFFFQNSCDCRLYKPEYIA